jgi:hypothetical protein
MHTLEQLYICFASSLSRPGAQQEDGRVIYSNLAKYASLVRFSTIAQNSGLCSISDSTV